MMDFIFNNQTNRRKVHAVLTNRMNRTCMDGLPERDRGPDRS